MKYGRSVTEYDILSRVYWTVGIQFLNKNWKTEHGKSRPKHRQFEDSFEFNIKKSQM
jgi:hypothetical protein